MTLIVRQATSSDLATIARFSTALALELEQRTLDPETLKAGLHTLFDDPTRGRFYLAEEHGRAVGQVMVVPEWSDWRNGWFWWLQSVYVIERARRRGVFTAMFNHIELSMLAEAGVCGLRLYASRGNELARLSSLRVGMRESRYVVMEFDRPVPAVNTEQDDAR
jgi:GNAT superfamily N-acetyltransferase